MMWESAVGESPQLAIEVVCRDFAFQGFNMKAIENRKGEDRLRPVDRGRKELHLQELNMDGLGILTLANCESMVRDTISINNTKNSFLGRNVAVRARFPMVTKWDEIAKSLEIDRLKEMAIPLLNMVERSMLMGRKHAPRTQLWGAKAMLTLIESLPSMT